MPSIPKLVFLSFIIFSVSVLALADTVETEVGVGANPGSLPPQICVLSRTVIVNPTLLWADAPTINIFNVRISMYAFTGEQIETKIVVRDPNGALDIGTAFVGINGAAEVLCNPDSLPYMCDGLRPTGANQNAVRSE